VSVKGKRVGFIGGGNMGEALIRGLVGANLVKPGLITATDVRADRAKQLAQQFGVTAHSDNARCVRDADVVILAVKPQIMAEVLREIAPVVEARHLLISIAAGVATATIRAALGKDARIIRVMPNTPALVGAGMAALAPGQHATSEHMQRAVSIFNAIGKAVTVAEKDLDAVTGLSGSGPGYVAVMVEALIDGGVRAGLARDIATTLAIQTVLGSAQMLAESGYHPAQLKDMVTSPGGTTIAGLHTLEQGGLRTTLINAVEAATKRSKELGEAILGDKR